MLKSDELVGPVVGFDDPFTPRVVVSRRREVLRGLSVVSLEGRVKL